MERNSPNILKFNWERGTSPVKLSQKEIESVVADYTPQKVTAFELFSKGCANSNYKVTLSDHTVLVLRVYTRDPRCLIRERKIHELIQDKVPVPRFFHINNENKIIPHPFAIMEYAEGILFRDLIMQGDKEGIESCSYQAGNILTRISSFQFKESGFFEEDLTVKPFGKDQGFFNFINSFLSNRDVIDALGKDLIKKLHATVEKHQPQLTDMSHHKHLTHADYDPSNILVKKENNEWRISAILDWEFALSSTYYMDMGLMLRYSHKVPNYFQTSFMDGIKDSNLSLLNPDWEARVKLVDILSLLSLCDSNSIHTRPMMFEDIKELLTNTCEFLVEK